jgi:hypothetical protein
VGLSPEHRLSVIKRGLCPLCYKAVSPGKSQCEACLKRGRILAKKKRIRARKKGLCIRCCVRKAKKDRTECQKCTIYSRNFWRKKFYNVSPEQVEQQRRIQKNKCAICRKEFTKTPHADHDHKIKKFRALLCSRCNKALGLFLENTRIMSNAIKYIRKYKRRKI